MRQLYDALLLSTAGAALVAFGAAVAHPSLRAVALALLGLAATQAMVLFKHAFFGVGRRA